MPSKRVVTVALVGGVLGISTSAVLIRLGDAPAPVMAFYRMFFAALFFSPLAIKQSRAIKLSQKQLALALGAGTLLALHFLLWMSSLSYTSVASSVVLATTHPIWVYLISVFFLKERPTTAMWLGLLFALVGGVIVTFAQGAGDQSRFLGNFLALGGAMMIAIYLSLGRKLRQELPLALYSALVFGTASLIIALFMWSRGLAWTGYTGQTWAIFLALALFPTVLGHNTLNWALKYLPATMVSAAVLGEPLGASLLAALILAEIPTGFEILGGLITLFGIFLVWKPGKEEGAQREALKNESPE